MSDRYNQYRILYFLYDKNYRGQINGETVNNLLQDESLKYIDRRILFGEIAYLKDHQLIRIDNISYLADKETRVGITSRGIDIINEILDNYYGYLKDRKDMDLEGAYNSISAIPAQIEKRRATNFYVRRRENVFKDFLSITNIFDRLISPNYVQRHKDIDKSIIGEYIEKLSRLPVVDRIRQLEDENMERKPSFRYDTSTDGQNKHREKQISKSIAGFMNTVGGILFIGVDNNGNVIGLKNDYSFVKNNNADGFQLELRNSIEHFLKKRIVNKLIDVKFHQLNGEEICEIVVKASSEPIILYDTAKEEFYIREGNSTKPYTLTQATEYCLEHFTS
jgi:Putative DNA-binding domain